MTTLFATADLAARELQRSEIPLVQALFDANPEYSQIINGRNAHANEAETEFDERPPAGMAWRRFWFLGLFERAGGRAGERAGEHEGPLAGLAVVVTDLLQPGVWHLGLFLIATRLHGRGVAQPAYEALEDWARREGAQWMRLGVALANPRARRFWQRQGFAELRRRNQVDTGGRLNDLLTCCKPLAGGALDDYLALVPRDAPNAELP